MATWQEFSDFMEGVDLKGLGEGIEKAGKLSESVVKFRSSVEKIDSAVGLAEAAAYSLSMALKAYEAFQNPVSMAAIAISIASIWARMACYRRPET